MTLDPFADLAARLDDAAVDARAGGMPSLAHTLTDAAATLRAQAASAARRDAAVLRDFAALAEAGLSLAEMAGPEALQGVRMTAASARDVADRLEGEGLSLRELVGRDG